MIVLANMFPMLNKHWSLLDADEFISQSGWFSFPGLPHCKEALYHVLAKKCKMSYEDFMACKEAVYYFDYINGEKVIILMIEGGGGTSEEYHKEVFTL